MGDIVHLNLVHMEQNLMVSAKKKIEFCYMEMMNIYKRGGEFYIAM